MHIVLVHPEIAPNTGNIIRLCANAGLSLHLIEPLGFSLDDRLLRRAGLDYHELARVVVHPDLAALRRQITGRWFAFSSRGTRRYGDVSYQPGDALIFGAERAGLPDSILTAPTIDEVLTIPMMPDNRSLNLANAVAIVAYEAWRQTDFAGSTDASAGPRPGSGLTSESPAAPPFDP